jgi:hypothetical protein
MQDCQVTFLNVIVYFMYAVVDGVTVTRIKAALFC